MKIGNGSAPTPETWLGILRSAYTLYRLGEAIGLSRSAIRASYRNAERLHAAANADLDGAP